MVVREHPVSVTDWSACRPHRARKIPGIKGDVGRDLVVHREGVASVTGPARGAGRECEVGRGQALIRAGSLPHREIGGGLGSRVTPVGGREGEVGRTALGTDGPRAVGANCELVGGQILGEDGIGTSVIARRQVDVDGVTRRREFEHAWDSDRECDRLGRGGEGVAGADSESCTKQRDFQFHLFPSVCLFAYSPLLAASQVDSKSGEKCLWRRQGIDDRQSIGAGRVL